MSRFRKSISHNQNKKLFSVLENVGLCVLHGEAGIPLPHQCLLPLQLLYKTGNRYPYFATALSYTLN